MQASKLRPADHVATQAPVNVPPTQGTQQAPPVAATAPGCTIDLTNVADPQATYRAAVALRDELRNQLDDLKQQRTLIAQRLRGRGGEAASGPDLTGLNARIVDLDAQIAQLSRKIAAADANVACTAGLPGAVTRTNGPDDAEVVMGALFMLCVMLPISIAIARRIWRRGGAMSSNITEEVRDRLSRLENAVESVAIEVERVGESQRFVTNILVEGGPHALGAGAAEPMGMRTREMIEQSRRESR